MRNGKPLLKILFPWAFNLFVGLAFLIGGGATIIYQPFMSTVFFVIGAITVLIGVLGGLSQMRDLINGRTKIVGFVTAKSVTEEVTDGIGTLERPVIRVEGVPFEVSHRIYDWVEEGDEVVVTYWKRVLGVVSVVKTGRQSLPDEEPPAIIQERAQCSEHPELSHESNASLHAKRVAQQEAIENSVEASGDGGPATQIEVAEENNPNADKSGRPRKKRDRRTS